MPTKQKSKKWNPGRPTIKALQARVKELEYLVQGANNATRYANDGKRVIEAELTRVKAENDALLKDKVWLKQVIQSFLSNDPLPRIGTR